MVLVPLYRREIPQDFSTRCLQKPENSNLHGFKLHRPSSKGTNLLHQVIKAMINQSIIFEVRNTQTSDSPGR